MNVLKDLRLSKNMTQTELAAKLGYPQTTYSGWERDRVEPNLEALIRIADFFEVSIDYLVGRSDELGRVLISNDLTLPEKNLVDTFRTLSSFEQGQVYGLAKTLSKDNQN